MNYSSPNQPNQPSHSHAVALMAVNVSASAIASPVPGLKHDYTLYLCKDGYYFESDSEGDERAVKFIVNSNEIVDYEDAFQFSDWALKLFVAAMKSHVPSLDVSYLDDIFQA